MRGKLLQHQGVFLFSSEREHRRWVVTPIKQCQNRLLLIDSQFLEKEYLLQWNLRAIRPVGKPLKSLQDNWSGTNQLDGCLPAWRMKAICPVGSRCFLSTGDGQRHSTFPEHESPGYSSSLSTYLHLVLISMVMEYNTIIPVSIRSFCSGFGFCFMELGN